MSVDNVADIEPFVQYVATASQTAFTYPFPIFEDADLDVYVNDTLMTLTTDYTVSGEGDDNGGTVTFATGRTAGQVITIARDVAMERTTDFAQNGPRRSADINDELDRMTMYMQQLKRDVNRSVRIGLTNAQDGDDLVLDSAFEEKYLYVNSDGELEPAAAIATTTLTQTVIAELLYPRTAAEQSASVTPTNYAYPPYNAKRYGATGDGSTDDTAALQSWLTASAGQAATIPSGTYKITARLNASSNTRINGEGRNTTLFSYAGTSTITNGSMLKWDSATAFAIHNVGFRCTNAGTSNETVQLHLEDCVYFDVSDVSFGGSGSGAGLNKIKAVLCDQTASGFVPPRGQGRFANFLAVTEPGDSGASVSAGIYIKGHASQSIVNVVFEGEGNIEHYYDGIVLENANNCWIGAWQIRQNTRSEIRLVNASNNTICGPQLVPTATTGTGITLDANSLDNMIINPGWNFSSGAPLAAITDSGSRNSVIGPGAPGGVTVVGKLAGPYEMKKSDGTGPNLKITRTATDTGQGGIHMLLSGQSMLAPAWFGIAEGSGISGQDLERFEVAGALAEKLDANGQRFLKAPPSSPGSSALANSQVTFYLDEVGDNLIVLVKYSNGAAKAGTIALV